MVLKRQIYDICLNKKCSFILNIAEYIRLSSRFFFKHIYSEKRGSEVNVPFLEILIFSPECEFEFALNWNEQDGILYIILYSILSFFPKKLFLSYAVLFFLEYKQRPANNGVNWYHWNRTDIKYSFFLLKHTQFRKKSDALKCIDESLFWYAH